MKKQISSELLKNISNLHNNKQKNDEFEFIIRSNSLNNKSLGFLKYNRLLKYLRYKEIANKLKLVTNNSIDINMSVIEKFNVVNLRVTIGDVEYNKILANTQYSSMNNHDFIKKLIELKKDKTRNITIMKKTKKLIDSINVEEFNFRVRLSKEEKIDDITNLLSNISGNKIVFRYKQRISLIVDNTVSIDLTVVRQSDRRNNINTQPPIYEIELENSVKSNLSLDIMFDECEKIIKVMDESNYLISKSEKSKVLGEYFNFAGKKTLNNLDGRRPESLEIENVTKYIPNKYVVTDKADGNRYFLFIDTSKVYLISYNLDVSFTGIELAKSNEKWNGTILDGEYLSIKNKFVFLCFDCLSSGKKDMRNEKQLMLRLFEADKLIKECFIFDKQQGHSFNDLYSLPENKIPNTLLNSLEISMTKYMKALNNDIANTFKLPLIRRKYFAQVIGIDSGEIFRNSNLLWKKYVLDSSFGCPYHLDGLIFQPQIQKYVTHIKNSEYKYPDYKWKPREHNSIDFYIEFNKDQYGNQIIYFDNTLDVTHNKPYKIINLFCGKRDMNAGIVMPVLFMQKQHKYIAHLFLVDGEVRDEQGNVLYDKTIVEFTYNTNISVPQNFRWIARNIRFDKTERVNNGIKEYGNYITTAQNIWKTMNNPLTIEDFEILGNGKTLDEKKKTQEIITKSATSYYQNIVSIAMPMKRFHNFIKSNMISTFVDRNYFDGKVSVLDLACGRGGDINKFYYGGITRYVGVDIDNDGLMNNIDGAVTRYKKLLKKGRGKKINMSFIHGNVGALLNFQDQQKALGYLSKNNEKLYNDLLTESNTFEIINCQFAVHYLLKDELTWNNFLSNINKHLKVGGFLLLTTFDGTRVNDLFKNGKSRYDSSYIDSTGKTKNLFTIIKKYEDKDQKYFGVGNAIEYTNILMFSEDVFHTEYIVDKKFLERELKSKCKLNLVDTDLFENQYNIHNEFFKTSSENEINKFKREPFKEILNFYDLSDSINKACYNLMRLNRYYVFQKTESAKTGGSSNTSSVKKIKSTKYEKYFGPKYTLDIPAKNKQFSFHVLVFNALQKSNIISVNTNIKDYYSKIGIPITNDKRITPMQISEMCRIEKINIVVLKKNVTYAHSTNISISFNKENKSLVFVNEANTYKCVFAENKYLFDVHDLMILMKIK